MSDCRISFLKTTLQKWLNKRTFSIYWILTFTVQFIGISETIIAFPTIFNASLSCKSNYDCIPVLKQSASRAIILAKMLGYAPHARFSHFLEATPFHFLRTIVYTVTC